MKNLREQIAEQLYEGHYPRIFHSYEELTSRYKNSAEALCQSADGFIALIYADLVKRIEAMENPFIINGLIPSSRSMYKEEGWMNHRKAILELLKGE